MKDKILNVLDNIYEAKIEINDMLGLVTAEELKTLEIELDNLVEDNIIYKTKKDRYILLKNCKNLKIGRLVLNKKGFGFVILDKEDDLYIPENDLNGATHDDVVLAEITCNGIKKEGRVVRINTKQTLKYG